jgi:hypothetical protein
MPCAVKMGMVKAMWEARNSVFWSHDILTTCCAGQKHKRRNGLASSDLIPPSEFVKSFEELRNRAVFSVDSDSAAQFGANPRMQQSPAGNSASNSTPAYSRDTDVNNSNVQASATDEMKPRAALYTGASLKGASNVSPAQHVSFLQKQVPRSPSEHSEARQGAAGLDAALQIVKPPAPPVRAALAPIRSVTQAFARLGITAKDASTGQHTKFNPAAWKEEWKEGSGANAQNPSLWRLQAITFIMNHRCVPNFSASHSWLHPRQVWTQKHLFQAQMQ